VSYVAGRGKERQVYRKNSGSEGAGRPWVRQGVRQGSQEEPQGVWGGAGTARPRQSPTHAIICFGWEEVVRAVKLAGNVQAG